jgi:hypothetical protein
VTRRLAPRDRGQLWFGSNADSAGAASVAHGPATRRRHPPTGSREARHLRPPTGRATRVPRSRRLSDTTVVHARALCKISRPARGQWRRTDGRLRWRRAGSLQHRASGALWSARSGASRHGRRKAVTAGAAGARSRLRKSQSNLPLGFTVTTTVGSKILMQFHIIRNSGRVGEEGGTECCDGRAPYHAGCACYRGCWGSRSRVLWGGFWLVERRFSL